MFFNNQIPNKLGSLTHSVKRPSCLLTKLRGCLVTLVGESQSGIGSLNRAGVQLTWSVGSSVWDTWCSTQSGA